VNIRKIAFWLAYKAKNCKFLGHDFWPTGGYPSDPWECRCGAVVDSVADEEAPKPLHVLAHRIAHYRKCWIGHEWFIEMKGRDEGGQWQWADNWLCLHCDVKKPFKRDGAIDG
jgi:hypothetical protein